MKTLDVDSIGIANAEGILKLRTAILCIDHVIELFPEFGQPSQTVDE